MSLLSSDSSVQTQPTQMKETIPAPKPASKSTPPNDGLHKLFDNIEYSDFTVHCGSKTWRVHRAIVCSRSSFFKKACADGFQEAKEAKITFDDDDPDLIEEMLMYLYTMDYPSDTADATSAEDMALDAKMYGIADKYALPDLKQKVRRAFRSHMADSVQDPLFAEAANSVYECTPASDRGLRDLVKQTVWLHKTTMLATEEIQQCIMRHSDFQSDILQALFDDPGAVGPKKERKGKAAVRKADV